MAWFAFDSRIQVLFLLSAPTDNQIDDRNLDISICSARRSPIHEKKILLLNVTRIGQMIVAVLNAVVFLWINLLRVHRTADWARTAQLICFSPTQLRPNIPIQHKFDWLPLSSCDCHWLLAAAKLSPPLVLQNNLIVNAYLVCIIQFSLSPKRQWSGEKKSYENDANRKQLCHFVGTNALIW